MKWIKQIFGIKDDTVELDDKFTNASATSELVVKPRVEQSNSDMQKTASLNKMTNTQIDEITKNARGGGKGGGENDTRLPVSAI